MNENYRNSREHYGPVAEIYHEQYDDDRLFTHEEYPANLFRLRIVLKRLRENGTKSVIDAGCGEGTPLVEVFRQGIEVCGFDSTPEMIDQAREKAGSVGIESEKIVAGNIEDPESVRELVAAGPYDAALCLGVMPHVRDEVTALRILRSAVVPETGRVYVSFRNPLFSMFTMNRFTHDFIVDELLEPCADHIREAVSTELKSRTAMDKPPPRMTSAQGGAGYDAILAKFHNPLTVGRLFEVAGLELDHIHWYHYHPAPPYMEGPALDTRTFRGAAAVLEGEDSGWRGYFLCSTYLVEARRAGRE